MQGFVHPSLAINVRSKARLSWAMRLDGALASRLIGALVLPADEDAFLAEVEAWWALIDADLT